MLYNSMQELIGNTPLVRLNHFDLPADVRIYAKLELNNPAGSVKDRIGKAMIDDAEARGILQPSSTMVAATAGNTGLGLAFGALNRGYRVIFVVPDKFSTEKQALMRALGAEIINTPREAGMLGASAKAQELLATIPNAVNLDQFSNPANPLAHYAGTGAEIYADLGNDIDYFIAGAGSGGTFTGVMQYLKERIPGVKGVLADPAGSTMGGGEHFDYDIEGIGNDFVPHTMDLALVDRVIKVTDQEAFEMARLLARKEGIIAGSSSGAALAAALKLSETIESGNIVTIFPDQGDRYFSKGLFE